jgi:hypothetical protein
MSLLLALLALTQPVPQGGAADLHDVDTGR